MLRSLRADRAFESPTSSSLAEEERLRSLLLSTAPRDPDRVVFGADFTRLRVCEITLDKAKSTAAWSVDGHTVYQISGTFIPERVGIGFGIWTMLPIRDGRSQSLDGQGMTARWRRFRVRGVDA